MTHHGLGVELRHSRRADHDRSGSSSLRGPAIGDAGSRAFRSRSRDDTNPSVDVTGDGLQHLLALRIVQPGDLARDAKHRHAIDAGRNEQVNHPAQTVQVQIP